MSWEVKLFYWAGWFSITIILALLGVIGSWSLWKLYNKKESAFRANAALFAAYLYHAYKYRFRNLDVPNMRKMKIDGYEISVKKVSDNG